MHIFRAVLVISTASELLWSQNYAHFRTSLVVMHIFKSDLLIFKAELVMELRTFSELAWSWSYALFQSWLGHGVMHIFRSGLVMELCTFSKQGWPWSYAHFQSRVGHGVMHIFRACLLYTSPSPRDRHRSRMPSSA